MNVKFKFDPGSNPEKPDLKFDVNKISHRHNEEALVSDGKVMGSFYAALFIDGICDGCVTVDCSKWSSSKLPAAFFQTACLLAFSIVTAPDFFSHADALDLAGFDTDGSNRRAIFFEGGLYSLSAKEWWLINA